MLRPRQPAASRQSRGGPAPEPVFAPPAASGPPARDLLLRSWPGRTFLAAAAAKVLVAILRAAGAGGTSLEALSTIATIALVTAVGFFVWRLFLLLKRRLLWRVRRKLILSYIFIGVVPALLIIAFFLLGAWVVSINVSAYLFLDGYQEVVQRAQLASANAAADVARSPADAGGAIGRVRDAAASEYPSVSLAWVPATGAAPAAASAGPWTHAFDPPGAIPDWVATASGGFAGTVVRTDAAGNVSLAVRAAVPAITETARLGFVVTDIPVDDRLFARLYEHTGVRAGTIRLGGDVRTGVEGRDVPPGTTVQPDGFALFGRGVTMLDTREWETGLPHRATVANVYALRELYQKLSEAQSARLGSATLGQAILFILVLVAGLFLIIQAVALIMGLALARSITSSIHELFMGTERVRHGDFTHRIDVRSNDQLGELAGSFNQMIGSIENLLQTAAEKKRLEEELRIARQIQMSLLPRGPLEVPGLAVTALCVPAREVGGDYYDFFPLPDGRLGVLIADVSGKGTSAALYMAELKGLVLSLSQIYSSPRQLLLETNRLIAANLDSRSFITMTYAVLDLAGGTMTYARGGHTPLIRMRGGAAGSSAEILTPSGMVLGLQIPGAAEKFAELLQEDRLELSQGDVIVLFTDGITEAMNPESDLFGETRLCRLVEEHGHLEPGELRERILREIEAFVGPADQHDDMTMILIKIEAAPAARAAGPAAARTVGTLAH